MLASRTFGTQDQESFACASGDINPMHMDPVVARRTQAGAPVVHGIHSLLWLLDEIASSEPQLPTIAKVKAVFTAMIYVGDTVDARIVSRDDGSIRGEVVVNGVAAVQATVTFGNESDREVAEIVEPRSRPNEPADLDLTEMSGINGCVGFASAPEEIARLFPSISAAIGADRVSAVACTTYIVGMVVPGLHSIYKGITLSCLANRMPEDGLSYRVSFISEAARFVQIDATGGGIFARIDSMVRHRPVAQPSLDAIAGRVNRNEFSHVDALVVGGSRGLGELTAKIIAAGGGRVALTYSVGSDDAESVANEINHWGATASTFRLDVLSDIDAQLGERKPSHVYYFATPPIFKGKHADFSQEKFDMFSRFYIGAFLEVVLASSKRRPEGVTLFYPSSVAVESRPAGMTEYAMAKAAGEMLCQEAREGVRIVVARLPRLATDQTASILAIKTDPAVDILLPIVRETAAK
jgi:acyl dehydratase